MLTQQCMSNIIFIICVFVFPYIIFNFCVFYEKVKMKASCDEYFGK